MSWFFEGSGYSDPQEAQRALAELVEERDNLQKTVTELEQLIETQKNEISGLEDQVGDAQRSAAKMVEQSRTRMQEAKFRESELEAVRRRLELTSSICDLSHQFRRIAQGIDAVRSCINPPPLVIAGPSGVGKASLITKLFAEFGAECRIPISHTSRGRAEGEQDGVHYVFVSRKEMEAGIDKGAFVEVADVDGELYGTSLQALADVRAQGKIPVLHIDIAGLEQLQSSKLSPVSVWVAPPSLAALQDRMQRRGLADKEEVAVRVAQAEKDMRRAKELERLLDFVLVNHDIDQTYEQLKTMLKTVPAYAAALQPSSAPPERPPRSSPAATSQTPFPASPAPPPASQATPPASHPPASASAPPAPSPPPAAPPSTAAGETSAGDDKADGAAAGAGLRAGLQQGSSGLLVSRKPLVIAGPSGVGKGTLIERLKAELPHAVGLCVSHTTRGPRPGEQDGVHYHFVDREIMQAEIKTGSFLEHAEVHDNLYGTSKRAVVAVAKQGRICVLDIDVQGCRQVRAAGVPATFVFVAPPSMEALEQRLRGRGTESEERVLRRLANAQRELEAQAEPGLFDHVVVNDSLGPALAALKAAIAPQLGELGVVVLPARAQVVLVLGGPGSGKGTQCGRAAAAFGWEHLSAGELLRAEVAAGGEQAEAIQACMREGRLVPSATSARLLAAAMAKSAARKFIIDGFPRSEDNQQAWEQVVGGQAEVRAGVELACSDAELERRLLQRAESSGRADDSLEAIRKRIAGHRALARPVTEALRQRGLLRCVDGEQPVEAVWALVSAVFRELEGSGEEGGSVAAEG